MLAIISWRCLKAWSRWLCRYFYQKALRLPKIFSNISTEFKNTKFASNVIISAKLRLKTLFLPKIQNSEIIFF
jgi:hypothetical protein